LIGLPLIPYAGALELKVMPLAENAPVILLVKLVTTDAPNTSESPETGGLFVLPAAQFAEVPQDPVLAVLFHVSVPLVARAVAAIAQSIAPIKNGRSVSIFTGNFSSDAG
jgi:hypothetical protein